MSAKSFLSKTKGFERRLGVSVCHHDWEAEGPGLQPGGKESMFTEEES